MQRVRPGENVWRCCQPFSGNKEQGYMSLKENQVRARACLAGVVGLGEKQQE